MTDPYMNSQRHAGLEEEGKGEEKGEGDDDENEPNLNKQSDEIAIHQGFYDYLLKERKDTPGKSKFDEIFNHVMNIFNEDGGRKFASYKLYVTGHSLGGALSTLFGYYATSKIASTQKAGSTSSSSVMIQNIPLPISIVSVASPRCGESFFQHSFRLLEQRGDLRHLRVVNDRDPVTIMPKSSTKKIWAMLSPISYLAFKLADSNFDEKETYKHTGIKLKLVRKNEPGGSKDEEGDDKQGSVVTYQLTYGGTTLGESSGTTTEETAAGGTKDRSIASTGGKVQPPKKKLSTKISTEDIPDVIYHMGNMYVDNLLGVKTALTATKSSKHLTLNGLYKQIE